jgi:hypothetical protein
MIDYRLDCEEEARDPLGLVDEGAVRPKVGQEAGGVLDRPLAGVCVVQGQPRHPAFPGEIAAEGALADLAGADKDHHRVSAEVSFQHGTHDARIVGASVGM